MECHYQELKESKVPFHKWLDFINEKLNSHYEKIVNDEKNAKKQSNLPKKKGSIFDFFRPKSKC